MELLEGISKAIIWTVYLVILYYTIFWLMFLFDKKVVPKVRKLKKFPKVTIAVPCYNEAGNISRTMKTLSELDYPKDKVRIIAINDGSTDNTLGILRKLQKKYGFEIINQKNKGKYRALNAALVKTTSEYFVCLDADSFVMHDALKLMVADFTNPRIAAVMPVMKVDKPKTWMERFQHLEYMTSIFLKVLMQRKDAIPVAPGPFTIYKTDVIKKLGAFRKGNYVEDMEMAFRLQSENYLLRQNLDAIVYTKAPPKFMGYYKQRIRWYGGTIMNCIDYRRMFFNKKFGDFGFIQLPMLLIAGALTLGAVSMVWVLKFKNLYHQFKYLALTNFDIVTLIRKMKLVFDPYSFDLLVLFTSFILLLIAVLLIFLSLKMNREKMDKSLVVTTVFFMFVYSTITAFVFLNVFRVLLFRKFNTWYK